MSRFVSDNLSDSISNQPFFPNRLKVWRGMEVGEGGREGGREGEREGERGNGGGGKGGG